MLNPPKGINSLAAEVLRLRDNPLIGSMVERRVAEFLGVREKDYFAWFNELAYCLLTAYSSAEMGQLCVDALCDYGAMFEGSVEEVAATLKCQGHRFADRRAKYIVEARGLIPDLKKIVEGFDDPRDAREWLVENVKGLGLKEASHFLRNVGYMGVAIIDRHVLSNMAEHGLIAEVGGKGITRRRYLEYERILTKVAEKIGMPLGEMDLYLWYRKTGKVLK